MKIIVRIPTEAYAYQEVEFSSLEEYNKMLPDFIKSFLAMRKKVKQLQTDALKNEPPF